MCGTNEPGVDEHLLRQIVQLVVKAAAEDSLDHRRTVQQALAALRQTARYLKPSLAPPVSLAVFGTTSAGKTSLINALVGGEPLIPTDADELSAGVLTLRHLSGRQTLLRVAGDDDVPWNRGHFHCTDPAEASLRIGAILYLYRSLRRRNSTMSAPHLELQLDLHGISRLVRFQGSPALSLVDLPGLLTVDDLENLPHISRATRECLPMVVVDYGNLHALEQLQALLKLLALQNRHMLQGGRPVVLLNKMDRVTSENRPVGHAITEVQRFCSTTLNLEVSVAPVSARLLQAGMALLERVERSGACGEQELQPTADLARHMISLHHISTRGHREDSIRFRSLINCAEDGEALPLEELHWFSRHLVNAGGGPALGQAIEREQTTLASSKPSPNLQLMVEQAVSELGMALSPAPETEAGLRRRQHGTVAALFQLLIEADGLVRSEEVSLAQKLLEDHWRRFGDAGPKPESPISSQFTDLKVEALLGDAANSPLPPDQARWVQNALGELMAVDRQVAVSEQELIRRVARLLSAEN